MLTSDLIRPRLRIQGSTLRVEMVNEQDPSLQQTAQDLIRLYGCCHFHAPSDTPSSSNTA